jgi:predicted hydrolase (HD superfamily)
MEVTRDRAWETLTEYTKSEALLRHALAVEAAVRGYADRLGEDGEFWSAAALLHDFD